MSHTVFVYGSLRRGLHNHHCLDGATFIGEAVMCGLKLVDLGAFPAAVESHQKTIIGELYTVDDAGLLRLDRLEGKGSHGWYLREQRSAATADGQQIVAWVYVMEEEFAGKKAVRSGDWKEHLAAKERRKSRV